jgi:hypothetical protein
MRQRKMQVMRTLASAMICVLLIGCATRLPDKVQPIEYDVYSQWLTQHFKNEPPKALYISDFTVPFGLKSEYCNAALKESGVSTGMVDALQSLGRASFPLKNDTSQLHISYPFEYSTWSPSDRTWTDTKAPILNYVVLSRVAFNPSQTQALFRVHDTTCAEGICAGSGGTILASKINGKWEFKSVGCIVQE